MADKASSRIVVGVDGSEPSLEALRWALDEARLRHETVDAVHVWRYPTWTYAPGLVPTPAFAAEDLEADARAVLDKAVDAVATPTDVPVERIVVEGVPVQQLVERSAGADMLVVGHRGHDGFIGLLLGSVAQHCTSHARCPVVVVRRGE